MIELNDDDDDDDLKMQELLDHLIDEFLRRTGDDTILIDPYKGNLTNEASE